MAGYVKATVRLDVFNAHVAAAQQPLKKFMVGFVGSDFWPIGSGTLVKAFGFDGILTAHHVSAEIFRNAGIGLSIVDKWDDSFWSASVFEDVPVGASPRNSSPETGPDLSFLVIRDAPLMAKLKKEFKEFYPLGREPSLHPILGNQHFWSITGTIGNLSSRRKTEDGARARIRQFKGGGRFQHEYSHEGNFDYLRLQVPSGDFGFPDDYQGISGGGFWLLPMEIDANEDPETIRHREPVLAGVEFAQLPLKNGERILVGHGPDSIYRQLNRSIDRCIALGFLESNRQRE